jgi:transcriptional regulator with XRE-family HTH domain
MDNLCHRTREIRRSLGLSQKEVASRMGISQTAFSRMERNPNPTLMTLKKIKRALGLESLKDLLGDGC